MFIQIVTTAFFTRDFIKILIFLDLYLKTRIKLV